MNITLKTPREKIAAALLFLIAALFAYKNYFIQDDAYIAFTYAKNFAQGNGLTWYPGSDEYGYTNFLYTLVVGIFMIPGFDPEYISAAINFFAYIAALILTYKLTIALASSRVAAYCAALALATHHTFSAYASGGLETMLVTAFIAGFYYLLLTKPISQITKPIAIIASAALLTRLDSAILLFPGYVWLLIQTRPTTISGIIKNKSLWLAAAIPTACVVALLAFAHFYYGYAMPNTFYAKMPGDSSMTALGLRYINEYLKLHYYIPAILLGLATLQLIRHSRESGNLTRQNLLIFATVTLWLSYVIYIGGDFMEFRLFVPILPLFAALIFSAAARAKNNYFVIVTIILCIVGNASHDYKMSKNALLWPSLIESTDGLYSWIKDERTGWPVSGSALHDLFFTGGNSDVKVATSAAGTLGFFSGLPVIDVHGINKRSVLENSVIFDYRFRPGKTPVVPRVGHQRIATDYFLENEGVNINIFHPQTICKNGDHYKYTKNISRKFPFKIHRTILIPISESCYLVADYINPHPKIDESLSKAVILDYRVHSRDFPCPKWLCNSN